MLCVPPLLHAYLLYGGKISTTVDVTIFNIFAKFVNVDCADGQVLKLWMAEPGTETETADLAAADLYGQSILSMLSYVYEAMEVYDQSVLWSNSHSIIVNLSFDQSAIFFAHKNHFPSGQVLEGETKSEDHLLATANGRRQHQKRFTYDPNGQGFCPNLF